VAVAVDVAVDAAPAARAAWFSLAPLMPVIKNEFGLSKDQIANINIAAVGITILVRLIVGPLADKYGPRRTYVALLVLGALPVVGISLAQGYESFLLCRLLSSLLVFSAVEGCTFITP